MTPYATNNFFPKIRPARTGQSGMKNGLPSSLSNHVMPGRNTYGTLLDTSRCVNKNKPIILH